ncbi:hypothetical protein BGZ72_002459 [Mortierella alpina]|nr:hypothetical protein BGZ72_002459 [Mortierella alpina]
MGKSAKFFKRPTRKEKAVLSLSKGGAETSLFDAATSEGRKGVAKKDVLSATANPTIAKKSSSAAAHPPKASLAYKMQLNGGIKQAVKDLENLENDELVSEDEDMDRDMESTSTTAAAAARSPLDSPRCRGECVFDVESGQRQQQHQYGPWVQPICDNIYANTRALDTHFPVLSARDSVTMTQEIVEATTQVQSTPATTLKEQKHAESKTDVVEEFHITDVSLFRAQQQSFADSDGIRNLMAPDHLHGHDREKHKHEHEEHKHDHEQKKAPVNPVLAKNFGDAIAGHTENMAAPPRQLNRM